jgi:DNA-binding response OmpR family regulator
MKAVDSIQDLRLLLVDDDESIRGSLYRYFQGRKVTCFALGTAEDALGQILVREADLVITDFGLSGSDESQMSKDVCSSSRSNGRGPIYRE